MHEREPLITLVITYSWMVALACFGGLANYIAKVKARLVPHFSITELVGELVISGFAGLITFYLCQEAHISTNLTAAMVGMAGHMGSRAIFALEMALRKKFRGDDESDR